MISHDLRNPLRSFQLFERFSLAPGKRRAVFDGVLLVSLGFLERLWVLLFEPYPFDLLLEETEGAAASRAPGIILRQTQPGPVEDFQDASLVDSRMLERQP